MKRYRLAWRGHELELGRRTRIMGILNVTPDSFSDGGRFFDPGRAIAHAERMVDEGADIIDIGGESTRPFSRPLSIEEEERRVLPVIEALAKRLPVPLSIDTTKSAVARRAIFAGASVINDISALRFDSKMGKLAATEGALLILMHMKGSPENMQVSPVYDDLLGEINEFFAKAIARAERCGVLRSHILVDPGIGFGKTVTHNLCLINHLERLFDLNVPLLVGPSRKAFIRKLLSSQNDAEPKPDHPVVETGTQAAVAAAVIRGAHMVRVHDVANTRATLNIIDAIRESDPPT
jgi:dihydropteroate synthase